jgi:hypothetical protein
MPIAISRRAAGTIAGKVADPLSLSASRTRRRRRNAAAAGRQVRKLFRVGLFPGRLRALLLWRLVMKLFSRMLVPVLALFPLVAGAVPVLQLDIAGGTYDAGSETVVTSDSSFTVYAYATPQGNVSSSNLTSRTLYLSIALVPQTGPAAASAGSFTVNGHTYFATADMIYGVPPIEGSDATHDGGDLGKHDVFETWFLEVPIELTAASPTSGEYNTADDAGQGPIAGDDMLYAAFDIDRSGLSSDYQLHFDLYATRTHRGDERIDFHVPYSHDAATVPGGRPTPEPSAALVFAVGLAAARWAGRR